MVLVAPLPVHEPQQHHLLVPPRLAKTSLLALPSLDAFVAAGPPGIPRFSSPPRHGGDGAPKKKKMVVMMKWDVMLLPPPPHVPPPRERPIHVDETPLAGLLAFL